MVATSPLRVPSIRSNVADTADDLVSLIWVTEKQINV